MLILLLSVAILLWLLSGSRPQPPSGGGGADDDLDELVGLDIMTDGRLDGHIGPRDEDW
jgi:hypothetical protein